MKIAVGADHAGAEEKRRLAAGLAGGGHEVTDVGAAGGEPVDYPDYAHAVARLVQSGRCERGVLVCGSGLGMAIAANRHIGVRAAACHTPEAARLARMHNDANVLCLGARLTPPGTIDAILHAWLGTPFEGGRHAGRVRKIDVPPPAAPPSAAPPLAMLALAAALVAPAGDARADRIVFQDGRVLEGRVTETPGGYRIEVPGGGILEVPRSQVARHETAPAPQDLFRERLAALAPDDAAGHADLARWATGAGMPEEARRAYGTLLLRDPAAPEALEGLGCENVDGIWMSEPDRRRIEGWMEMDGRWYPPDAYWPAYVERQARAMLGSAAERDAARAALMALRDPRAEPALMDALRSRRAGTREAVLAGLAGVGTPTAWDRIVTEALEGEDEETRRAAASVTASSLAEGPLAALNRRVAGWYAPPDPGRRTTVPPIAARQRACEMAAARDHFGGRRALFLVAMLDPSLSVRRAAGTALARVPDERIFQGLLEALRNNQVILQSRAASTLEIYGDRRAIGPLIDALERLAEFRRRSAVDPVLLNQAFNFEMPGLLRMSEPIQSLGAQPDEEGGLNLSVLPPEVNALQRLSGQALGEDVARWRAWFEREVAGGGGR